ncbi:MAG: 50S ribosomal protein L23 [SAR324 cluster bacterium]|nr:50S ribosomal protein L23 [SAR324 cluster bacterium]
MSLYNVIRRPLLTEKTTLQHEFHNQVAFEVAKQANRIQIKESIEKAFNVTVLQVRTIVVKGKTKRLGRHMGKRSDWKKAIITLKEGDKIEYFEGA